MYAITTGSDTTHTYTVGSYDDLSIMAVPNSSPTSRTVYWGLVCYIATAVPSLTNDPSSKAFGVVAANTTYYAKGSAPSNPVVDGDCTFTVTNDGSIAVDIDVKGTNFTGGVGWTLTGSAPGSNTVRITTYKTGDNPASGIVLTTSDQEFVSNLAAAGHTHWDFKFETGTFTDGVAKSSTLTLTARTVS